LAKLREELQDLPDFETERDELADAYEEYQTAEFRVQEHSDVPDELEEKRDELAEEQSALEEIESELAAFEGLDEELKVVEETLEETEPAYQTFIQHEQQAAQVEERREAVEELEGELEELEGQLEEMQDDLDAAKSSFDADRFDALDSEIEKLKGEIQRAKGTLDEKQATLEETREEIERLETKLEDRQEKLQQLKELKADQQFAEWVRENVRNAGPKMREIITDRIGGRANELFRSIRGVGAETLEWTSDYEIVVHDADVRKSFSTLSGGEKMAAALAVRLAILEQLASVGIAFLDEPTANLDRQKKRNLVTQLKQLDSFDQLTVISHDETFDSMTDYTITVTKDQQTSAVTVN
jgi:exonuclease SbcC